MLQSSFDRLREIGRKEEMRDVEIKDGKTSQGFVYSKVKWIVEANRRLNLYNSISEYCKMTGKNFNIIALLMAEYRGMEKVRGRIRVDSNKLDRKNNVRSAAGTARFSGTCSGDSVDPEKPVITALGNYEQAPLF